MHREVVELINPNAEICVLNVNPGKVADNFAWSLTTQRTPLSIIGEYSHVNIVKARNETIARFLETDHELALFLDSDTILGPLDIYNLHTSLGDHTIMGALIAVPGRQITLISKPDTKELWRDYPRNTVVETGPAGMGCLLVHRSVFEDISKNYTDPHPWCREDYINDTWHSEDWFFCHRALEVGHPIYINTAVQVGHQKGTRVYYPGDF